ncbi:hypothetical protein ACIQXD_26770 [Streptomyces uncialis]|uniref:hypothetical protein n=1 Tax=Streptomyces uncialis TaxID=1048205 RepID=UPI0038004E88
MHAIALLAQGVSCGNPPSEVADTAAGPPFALFAALRPAPFLVVLPGRHAAGEGKSFDARGPVGEYLAMFRHAFLLAASAAADARKAAVHVLLASVDGARS